MSFLMVDKEICNQDGICVAECPAQIIGLTDDGFPAPVEGAEELCIHCGHCVAVCPQGAMSLNTMGPAQCPPVRRELFLSAKQAENWVLSRRSIRCFREKLAERALIEKLIRISRYAPTGGNLQPVHWLVIESPAEVKRVAGLVVDWMKTMLDGRTPAPYPLLRVERTVRAWEMGRDSICRGAPHLIVAHGLKDLPASLPACYIALTTLDLVAPSFGLGTCWAGYVSSAINSYPPLFETLGLPKDHQSFGAMMVGYPKYDYHRIPLRNEPVIHWR